MTQRRARREGYVSILAISFALGLALLGSAIAVGLSHYLRAAVGREQAIVDRITLESAAAAELGRLFRGAPHPAAPHAREIELNGRLVTLLVSMPAGKHDLGMDGRADLVARLDEARLPNGLAELLGPGPDGLALRSRRVGLGPAEEDRLRRSFTLGRAPGQLNPLAADGADIDVEHTLRAGSQVDVRVGFRHHGDEQILWLRARHLGDESGAWALHDHRRLRIPGAG